MVTENITNLPLPSFDAESSESSTSLTPEGPAIEWRDYVNAAVSVGTNFSAGYRMVGSVGSLPVVAGESSGESSSESSSVSPGWLTGLLDFVYDPQKWLMGKLSYENIASMIQTPGIHFMVEVPSCCEKVQAGRDVQEMQEQI